MRIDSILEEGRSAASSRRRLRVAPVMAALVLLLAACGTPSSAPSPGATEIGAAPSDTPTTVIVRATHPLLIVTVVLTAGVDRTAPPLIDTPAPSATLVASATQPPSPAPIPSPSDTPGAAASDTPGPLPVTPRPSPRPSATRTPVPAPTPTVAPTPEWQTRSLLAGPGQPGRLYAFQGEQAWAAFPPERSRLLISDDYGQTWTPFPGGLPPQGCIYDVNLDYATPDALYAGTCNGLYRWTGSEWSLVTDRKVRMVAVVYGRPQVIWAAALFGTGAAVIRSDDGGATWTPAAGGLVHFNGVATIGIDPRDANTLYAIIWPKYAGSYLRRGTADGQWQTMPTPNDNAVINPTMTIDGAGGALYVVTNSPGAVLWRSSNPNAADVNDVRWELVRDFGSDVDWNIVASGWSLRGVALYAAVQVITHLGGNAIDIAPPVIQRSEDNGQTWTPLPIPGD